MENNRIIILSVLFLLSGFTVRAQYIDPGSGSYIFQLLLGGFLAFIFYFKIIRNKVAWLANQFFKFIKKR